MKKQIIKEDIQKMAYQSMLDRLKSEGIKYDEHVLSQMTFKLFENIDKGIKKIMTEAFDNNLLKGIDFLPQREVPIVLKNLVGNIRQKKSPFAPIQAISLYFSKDGAMKHSVGAKPIITHLMKDKDVSNAVWVIQQSVKKIEELINKKGMGYSMIYEFSYLVDDIINSVNKLNAALNKNYQLDWFRGTEAIDGSADGKRVGLASILVRASMNMAKLKEIVNQLKALAKKGKDSMSYSIY